MKKTIVLLLALSFVLSGCGLPDLTKKKEKNITPEEAGSRAAKFINENLMNQGNEVSVKEITEEGGLYKMTVSLPNGKEITSYMTKDGKKFFPEAMDVNDKKEATSDNASGDEQKNAATVKNKKDAPEVELFVMSHCPYGTQIEKGILPVLETLGSKIKFTLKFVDYAMHGEKELNEELNQYCIQKENPDKLIAYLKCFLKDENSSACVKKTGISAGALANCVAAADKEYKVKEKFNDKSTWAGGSYPPFDVYKEDNNKYGVQGSPTLVINGEEVQAGRDSASLLAAVCSGFNNQPEECKSQLSSAAPSPGFGEGTSASSAGGCGQ